MQHELQQKLDEVLKSQRLTNERATQSIKTLETHLYDAIRQDSNYTKSLQDTLDNALSKALQKLQQQQQDYLNSISQRHQDYLNSINRHQQNYIETLNRQQKEFLSIINQQLTRQEMLTQRLIVFAELMNKQQTHIASVTNSSNLREMLNELLTSQQEIELTQSRIKTLLSK